MTYQTPSGSFSRYLLALVALVFAIIVTPALAFSHCQVPCGIYDDKARIDRLHEDVTTIEKAVGKMRELQGKTDVHSVNQMTRWIAAKEEHASNIIKIVAEYFLAQKVSPQKEGTEGYPSYLSSLAKHHAVMVAAMKTKQDPRAETVKALHDAVEDLGSLYTK